MIKGFTIVIKRNIVNGNCAIIGPKQKVIIPSGCKAAEIFSDCFRVSRGMLSAE